MEYQLVIGQLLRTGLDRAPDQRITYSAIRSSTAMPTLASGSGGWDRP